MDAPPPRPLLSLLLQEYDATELMRRDGPFPSLGKIFLDQGSADSFLTGGMGTRVYKFGVVLFGRLQFGGCCVGSMMRSRFCGCLPFVCRQLMLPVFFFPAHTSVSFFFSWGLSIVVCLRETPATSSFERLTPAFKCSPSHRKSVSRRFPLFCFGSLRAGGQLTPEALVKACEEKGQPCEMRMQVATTAWSGRCT